MRTKTLLTLYCSLFLLCGSYLSVSSQSYNKNIPNHNLAKRQNHQENDPHKVSFMVWSDLHYFSPQLIINEGAALDAYLAQDRKMITESSHLMQSLVDKVLEMKPDYMLVPGDLTKDGEELSHTELAAMFKRIEENGTEVLVVPGNHDINNPHAASFDGDISTPVDYVSPEQFENIYADYGYNQAELRDEHSLSYLEKFSDDSPFWLLALDVCHYDNNIPNGSPETAGSIKEETMAWIEEIMQEANEKGIEVMAMMHHGMLEHYNYHSAVLPEYMIENWEAISEKLANLGMSVVFTGHSHAQDITQKITSKGYVINDVETGSLVTYPCPYRWCEFNEDGTLLVDGGKIHTVDNVDGDFQDYAYNYIHSGFPNLVSSLLVHTLGVPSILAEMLKMPVTNAFIAHYAGDEQSPSEEDDEAVDNVILILKLSGRVEEANYVLALYQSIWTDLKPVDWNTTIDLHEKYSEQCDLTLFHNNDGMSQLLGINANGQLYGSIAAFKSTLNHLRNLLQNESLLLSSGNNYTPGLQFQVGLDNGNLYEALAMDAMKYDAIGLGNHDFDLGTSVLAQFINGFESKPAFLSCNLSFSADENLAQLVNEHTIAPYLITECNNVQVGIIGVTAPDLEHLYACKNISIADDMQQQVQQSIDELTEKGINRIILISHLQTLVEDIELASNLEGVDIVVAGGNGELLGEEGNAIFPGDDENGFYGSYPLVCKDKNQDNVYVVTTPGLNKYVGKLDVDFDQNGVISKIGDDSGLYLVEADTYGSDAELETDIQYSIQETLNTYASKVVAESQVELNGTKADITTKETNLGNLVTDALLWQSNQLTGVNVDVALIVGNRVGENQMIQQGSLYETDIYDVLETPSFITIIEGITPTELKEALELSVAQKGMPSDLFLQVGGMRIEWDDSDSKEGERIVSVTLNDGTVLIDKGNVEANAPDVNIAFPGIVPSNGNAYSFITNHNYTTLPVTTQMALLNYLEQGLTNQIVTTDEYPEGGEGRITIYETYTGNETIAKERQLKIYPNPLIESVTVDVNEDGIFTLTDVNGLDVFERFVYKGSNTFGLSNIRKGIYVYKIKSSTGINTGMVVKK